jgi:uncharacterized Ntn-hydrolase superfamily protein
VDELRGTFSIVAADVAAGEVGVAVQSKYFSVGSVVPWARAEVGAVATQAAGIAGYGPQILTLLEHGRSPQDALDEALSDDPRRQTRQLGVVTASGTAVAWTGEECNEWAGHVVGDGFAAQGNILAGEEVVREMARAYEEGSGPLAERLLAALEAGQAAGGDRRGQQSAAIVVERAGGADRRERIDRICDLRVEDHERPIEELRRLLELWQVQHELLASYELYESKEYGRAIELMAGVAERRPDDAAVFYNLACFESLAGRREDAIAHVRRALELDPSLQAMADADSDFDPIRDELAAPS